MAAASVNFPNVLRADTPFAFARMGSFQRYNLKFVVSTYVGLGATLNDPATASIAQQQDESVVVGNRVAVTAMQVGFEHNKQAQDWVKRLLHNAAD